MADVKIAGTDLATLGFKLRAAPNFRAALNQAWPRARASGTHLALPLTDRPRPTSIPLSFRGTVSGSDVATADARIDSILRLATSRAEVAIEMPTYRAGTWFGRLHRAKPGSRTRRDYGTISGAAAIRLQLDFVLLDPWRYSPAETAPATAGASATVDLGTAPSVRGHAWTLSGASGVSGGLTITVTPVFSGAAAVATVKLTGALGNSASLVLDHEEGTIVDGDGASQLGRLERGSPFPLILDPAWSPSDTSPQLTIALASGSGSGANLEVAWRKAWIR